MTYLGRYRLDHVLGSGAFATVWRGYDTELDAEVAVKVLADNWAVNADVRERFLTEARLLRKIESRRVVRVHDVGVASLGEAGGEGTGISRPYFVMDYIEGGTLQDLIGLIDPATAIYLAAEAAYAVQVLHESGVLHRDVKPTNLLVDRTGEHPRVLAADLGSAKMLADASGITVTAGSPAYMAPEQALNVGGFDARADVYALGVVTFELLTGRRPFDTVRTPRSRVPETGVPGKQAADLDSLIGRALEFDPDRRPKSAGAYADELRLLFEGQRPIRRDIPAAWVIAGASLAGVGAGALAWWLR